MYFTPSHSLPPSRLSLPLPEGRFIHVPLFVDASDLPIPPFQGGVCTGLHLRGYVCWCVHVCGHVVSLVASPLCLGGGLILTLLFQGIRVLVLIVLCIGRSMGPGLLCIAEEKDGGRRYLIPHHYHPAGAIDINLFLFSRR